MLILPMWGADETCRSPPHDFFIFEGKEYRENFETRLVNLQGGGWKNVRIIVMKIYMQALCAGLTLK